MFVGMNVGIMNNGYGRVQCVTMIMKYELP